MRQRVGIAIALICNPELLIADEPTTSLDVTIQAQILRLIQSLQRELGCSVLLITHDLGVVAQVADDVAVMYLGRIVEQAPTARLFGDVRHPYTRALFAAVLVAWPGRRPDEAELAGEVPSPLAPPSGCRFHTRCPHAMPRCAQEEPALREVAPQHVVACHLFDD